EDIGRTFQNLRDQVAIALAPVIGELANRFMDAAAEAGGFKDVALGAVESTARGFGKAADVIQGLRVVIKGVQLVVVGFGAAVASVFEGAATIVTGFVDGIIWAVNQAIGALNKLPKVDIAYIDPLSNSPFMRGLHRLGDEARNKVGDVRSELHELAMQQLPSEQEGVRDAVRDRS